MGYPNADSQNPKQFVIMQDPSLDDASLTSSSQGSQFTKTPIPDSANDGDLVPFVQQKSSVNTAMVDKDLYELRSGGLIDNAEWGWKDDTDLDDQYRGMDDVMFIQNANRPFGWNQAAGSGYGYGNCVCVSKRYNRVLLIKWSSQAQAVSTSTLSLAYRDLDADPYTWTAAKITLDKPYSTTTTDLENMVNACVELPDGSLRLLVGKSSTDFDLYKSIDGGLTWSLMQTDVFGTYYGAAFDAVRWGNMDISGDWIRISVINDNSGAYTVRTLVSSDRGATFIKTTDISNVIRGGRTAGPDSQEFVFDIVGTGTADGGFYMIVTINDGGSTKYYRYSATADSDWLVVDSAGQFVNIYYDTFPGYIGSIMRAALYCDGTWIYEIIISNDVSVGGGGGSGFSKNIQWHIVKMPVNNIVLEQLQNVSSIYALTKAPAGSGSVNYQDGGALLYRGCIRYEPAYLRIKQAGDRAFLYMGLTDSTTVGNPAVDQSVGLYIRGWSRKPIRNYLPDNLYPLSLDAGGRVDSLSQFLFGLVWQAWTGDPYSGGSSSPAANEAWTETKGLSTRTWSPLALKLSKGSGVATHYSYYTKDGSGSGAATNYMDGVCPVMDGGIVIFRVYVEPGVGDGKSWNGIYPNVGMMLDITNTDRSNKASINIAVNSSGTVEVKDLSRFASGSIQFFDQSATRKHVLTGATITLTAYDGTTQTYTAASAFATGGISLGSGPANTDVPSVGSSITIISTDGTSKTYTAGIAEDINSNVFLSNPGSTTGTDAATSLRACMIDTTYGHGLEISVTRVAQVLSFSQTLAGFEGNTTITTSGAMGGGSVTSFTGGLGGNEATGTFCGCEPFTFPAGSQSPGTVQYATGEDIARTLLNSINNLQGNKVSASLSTVISSAGIVTVYQGLAGAAGNTAWTKSPTPSTTGTIGGAIAWQENTSSGQGLVIFTDFTGGSGIEEAEQIKMGGLDFSGASPLNGEGYADIRLAFTSSGSQGYMQLSCTSNSGSDQEIFTSEKVEISLIASAGAGSQQSSVSWGNIGPNWEDDAPTSYWKGVYIRGRGTNYNQVDFVNPTDVRGLSASPYEAYIDDGMYLKWGGAGGVITDKWHVNVGYTYPMEALKVASPNVAWRSTGDDTDQYIQFKADSTNMVQEMRLDGVGLFNTNFRYFYIAMASTDNPWPNAVSATASVNLGTATTSGDWIQFKSTDNTVWTFTAGASESKADRVFQASAVAATAATSLYNCMTWTGNAVAEILSPTNNPTTLTTVTITSTDRVSLTYTAAVSEDTTQRKFDQSGTLRECLLSLQNCIDDVTHGHGTRINTSISAVAYTGPATLYLEQATGGSAGNTTITWSGTWAGVTVTGFSKGTDSIFTDKISVVDNTGSLSLAQSTKGTAGNNTISYSWFSTDPTVSGFSGGSDGSPSGHIVDCAIATGLEAVTVRDSSIIVRQSGGTSTDIFRDGQLKNYIAYITPSGGAAGTTRAFRISHNYGRLIHFSGLTSALSTYSFGANPEVVIVAPFGVHRIGSYNPGAPSYDTINKVARVWVPNKTGASADFDNPSPEGEGYFQIGAIVSGPVVGFDVPMDWQSQESNEPNFQEKSLPNGMRVAYKLGPPRRSYKGQVVGDAKNFYPSSASGDGGFTGFRRMFRDMISSFSEYRERPMCLILDGDAVAAPGSATSATMGRSVPDTIMYCRYMGSIELQDQGWDVGENPKYRFGDMAVSFEEEL